MSKMRYLFLLPLMLAACQNSGNRGYLARGAPSPLIEKNVTRQNPAPLEIIEKQARQLQKLKHNNQLLRDRLAIAQAGKKNLENTLVQLRRQLDSKASQEQQLQRRLQKITELNQLQEEKIVYLTIEKVRLEQELLQLKIQSLKKKKGGQP